MGQHTQIILAEIDIAPGVIIRSCIGGHDVVYNGETYFADGKLVGIGSINQTLQFENSGMDIKINYDDTQIRNAINNLEYRYRKATILKGFWYDDVSEYVPHTRYVLPNRAGLAPTVISTAIYHEKNPYPTTQGFNPVLIRSLDIYDRGRTAVIALNTGFIYFLRLSTPYDLGTTTSLFKTDDSTPFSLGGFQYRPDGLNFYFTLLPTDSSPLTSIIPRITRPTAASSGRGFIPRAVTSFLDAPNRASIETVSHFDRIPLEDGRFFGFKFVNSGNRMFVNIGSVIKQYDLTTAYDIPTAMREVDNPNNGTFDFRRQDGKIRNFVVGSEGRKLYVSGFNSKAIYGYTLTRPNDITSAVYDNESFAYTVSGFPTPTAFESGFHLGILTTTDDYTQFFVSGDELYTFNVTGSPGVANRPAEGTVQPADNKLKDVRIVKQGLLDTHKDPSKDGTVVMQIATNHIRAVKSRTDITAQEIHNLKLNNGDYGSHNIGVTDNIFINTGKDFGSILLGSTGAFSERVHTGYKSSWLGFRRKKTYTTFYYDAVDGDVLPDTGEGFHPSISYGGSALEYSILDAFNTSLNENQARFPGVSWAQAPAHTVERTRFVTMILVVAQGALTSLNVTADIVEETSGTASRTLPLNRDNSQYITFGVPNREVPSQGGQGGEVTVQGGAVVAMTAINNETGRFGFPQVNGAGRTNWISGHKAIGHTLVMVTIATADRAYPDAFPQFRFTTGGKRISRVELRYINPINSLSNSVGDIIYNYLTNKAYGLGIVADDIDRFSFYDANYAFTTIRPNIYPESMNGTVSGAGSYVGFLKQMTVSCGMSLYERNGKISLYIGRAITREGISHYFYGESHESRANCIIAQENARASKALNSATATYDVLEDDGSSFTELRPTTLVVANTTLITADNGITNGRNITMPFQTFTQGSSESNKTIVRKLLNLEIAKTRAGTQQIKISTDYFEIKDIFLGDVVQVEEPRYGWTGNDARRYKVIGVGDNNKGGATLTCSLFTNATYGGDDSIFNI